MALQHLILHSSFLILAQGLIIRRVTLASHPFLLRLGFSIHCEVWTVSYWRGSRGTEQPGGMFEDVAQAADCVCARDTAGACTSAG